ncbi:MAG: helix-turn-helix domain-containing protein [Candidatus Latescibacterota bacterium]
MTNPSIENLDFRFITPYNFPNFNFFQSSSQNLINYKKLLTTGDVASHCQVSYETVSNWIKGGKLKSHATPGRHRRISREDFIDFLSVHDMPPLDETPSTPERRRLLLVDDEPASTSSFATSSVTKPPTNCARPTTALRQGCKWPASAPT